MSIEEKNLVQVYGLPRSGTNFMEWTLKNNFSGIDYKNLYSTTGLISKPIKSGKYSLKHTYPNLIHSKFAIVIYKEYNEWCKSFKKAYPDNHPDKKIYDTFLRKARELPREKVIVIEFRNAYRNYEEFIYRLSKMIGIEPNKKIKKPKNKLDRGGANTKETGQIFTL